MLSKKKDQNTGEVKMIPPEIEPGPLSVLDSGDNRYTMESILEGDSMGNELL